MFGRTKDAIDTTTLEGPTIDDFLGDEEELDQQAMLAELRDRVVSVEQQLHSQFTSMAAYAQIAQEQVELVRAEAKAHTERTEERLIELIERERADRIEALTGRAPVRGGSDPAMQLRLEVLDRNVAEIRAGLDDCLARQKALADAITALFEPAKATLPPPSTSGPIDELNLDG